MLQNKEDLKNKIIYRASYRGTKEMDILMIAFVKSLINTLDIDNLIALDKLVNMNDESLISIKKKETIINNNDKNFSYIIKLFQDY
jgi:antitoxin CptB